MISVGLLANSIDTETSTCTKVILIIARLSRERMIVFYGWTKTHLLGLCFILISYLIYLVGIHCMTVEDSTSLHVPFHLSIAEALIVFCVILFFLEKICLSGLLYVQAHEQFYFLVVGTMCEFSSILYFVFAGDLSISFEMDLFSSAFPAANASVSSNQMVPMHPKFILALAGTLLKGLSWIFIIFLAMAKTYSFSHQDITMHRNNISNFCVSVRMVIFIAALYYSIVMWTMMVSSMFPDFIPFIYTMYLFYPYLISLAISECIDDSRVTRGVFLSIISVFMTFLVKNLLDLVGTICLCSSHWTQQCIEQNPIYYSTMVSNGVAGVLLWMCISEFWPLSDKNPLPISSRDKPSDLSEALALEEGYLKTLFI